MITRLAIIAALSILIGCGSPYPNIRSLAADSPGIEIADVELMAYQDFARQAAEGMTVSGTSPGNLFLSSYWNQNQIRAFYQSSGGTCEDLSDAALRCNRLVEDGRTVRVTLTFEVTPTRSHITRMSAMTRATL